MKFIDYPSYIKKTWMFLYKAGNYTGCHQIPERSFYLLDMQFPICARCTGVLMGEIISIAFIKYKIILDIKLDLLFLAIMFTDWFIQQIKFFKSNNFRRFITGTLCGIGLIEIYYKIFAFIISKL